MNCGVRWAVLSVVGAASCACTSAVTPTTPGRAAAPAASAPSATLAPPAVAAVSHNVLPGPDPSRFLSAISLELSPKLESGTIELVAPDYKGATLGELNARNLLLSRTSEGRISARLTWPSYTASLEPVKERETRCSFVVDCDEPSVLRVEAALQKDHPSPSARDVIEFVAKFIDHKHMARGFDIASVVAQKREGDCTEHAVLTAALLRASGIPSHIVTGAVVVQIEGKLLAFGHAWAESHDGKNWQLADATNVGQPPQAVAYLPLRVMRNEGPGFAHDGMANFDVYDITGVTLPQTLKLAASSP